MDDGDLTRQLLTEIRDAQREHLAEYKRVAARSLELQACRMNSTAHAHRRCVSTADRVSSQRSRIPLRAAGSLPR